MEAKEAAVLLAKVAAYDRRSIGRADSEAWADAMTRAGIDLDAALEAVGQHFAESHNWLMPAHIIVLVRAAERVAVRDAPRPVLPPDLTPAAERAWLAVYWAEVKAGSDGPQASADASLGISRAELPPAQPGRLLGVIAAAPLRRVR